MKPTALIIALIALATGCSSSVQSAHRGSQTAKVSEPEVVLPSYDAVPPGTMDFAWTPTPPPPPKKITPRELDAKPHFVSNKKTRGRLFVAPTVNKVSAR